MRIGITTGGGDCPGLNAVIRAAVKTAVGRYGWEVVGIEDGLEGLVKPNKLVTLSPAAVRDILPVGGTILGSTNRGNPFRYPVERDGAITEEDISDDMLERIRQLGIDGMIFVGGDGTQAIAQGFADKGLNVIGVPKTIDNDLAATDYTFGFDTAVNVAMEALDRLRTTGRSHDRVMVLELMGRHAGWIAAHAGIAGDADVILIPEIPYDPDVVAEFIRHRQRAGISHAIVVVAEGASPRDGTAEYVEEGGAGRVARLGGAGDRFVHLLQDRGEFEARVTVLGHIQRGGTPSHFDRVLGTRFGVHAIELANRGAWGRMVCLRGTEVGDVPIPEAIGHLKQVDPLGTLVDAGRAVGICFGDELP